MTQLIKALYPQVQILTPHVQLKTKNQKTTIQGNEKIKATRLLLCALHDENYEEEAASSQESNTALNQRTQTHKTKGGFISQYRNSRDYQ